VLPTPAKKKDPAPAKKHDPAPVKQKDAASVKTNASPAKKKKSAHRARSPDLPIDIPDDLKDGDYRSAHTEFVRMQVHAVVLT